MFLAYDAQGRLRLRPLSAGQGVPASAVSTGAIHYDSAGAMLVRPVVSVPADAVYNSGMAFSPDGALYVTSQAPQVHNGGIPCRNDGAVCIGGQGLAADMSFALNLDDAGAGAVNLVPAVGVGSATFTRATTATTINSAGLVVSVASGVARSMYDPTSLAYLGYLAEGARTNLLLRSEEFDNASWSKTRSTISANATTSPDGTANADKLVEDATAANTHTLLQAVTATADVAYTVSFFFKAAERQWMRILIANGANSFGSYFDVGTGALGSSSTAGTGTFTGATIKAYPNGWYRCSVTGTVGSGATAISAILQMATANNTVVYDGDGASGMYVWGAQFENNVSFASSYIPTAGSTVTRNADVLSYAFAGNADATKGTFYAEMSTEWASGISGGHSVCTFSGLNGPMSSASAGPVSTGVFIRDGTNAPGKAGLASSLDAIRKRASSWGAGGLAITGDGLAVAAGSFDGDLTSAGIGIGCSPAGANQWFGTLKNVRIGMNELSAGQLSAVTA